MIIVVARSIVYHKYYNISFGTLINKLTFRKLLMQIEGAFVQGIGFLMQEEFLTNSEGLAVTDSTWTYKIPTIDTVPKQLNIELLSSGYHQKRLLSSKGMFSKLFYCFLE